MTDDRRWPDAGDEAGWSAVVSAGALDLCPPGIVVGALQALFRHGSPRLVRCLAAHVSDRVRRRLRGLVSGSHPNSGEDVVDRAHFAVMQAIFDPEGGDGADLVVAFWPRTRFRGLDATRVEGRFHRRHVPLVTDDDGEARIPRGCRLDGGGASIDVGHLLGRIADPRKRLAFQLFMEGMRVRRGDPCVASACGCDPKTAARWIAEARATLAAELDAAA